MSIVKKNTAIVVPDCISVNFEPKRCLVFFTYLQSLGTLQRNPWDHLWRAGELTCLTWGDDPCIHTSSGTSAEKMCFTRTPSSWILSETQIIPDRQGCKDSPWHSSMSPWSSENPWLENPNICLVMQRKSGFSDRDTRQSSFRGVNLGNHKNSIWA